MFLSIDINDFFYSISEKELLFSEKENCHQQKCENHEGNQLIFPEIVVKR